MERMSQKGQTSVTHDTNRLWNRVPDILPQNMPLWLLDLLAGVAIGAVLMLAVLAAL